jgi:hypothetical protein
MTLRLFERSLLDVKPEQRHLYIADTERGYRLDVSDLDEFVHGLRSALKKQRDQNRALRHEYGLSNSGKPIVGGGE